MCEAGDDAEILQGANSAAMCPPVTILSRFVKSQDSAPHLQAFSSHVSYSLVACGSMSHHFVPCYGRTSHQSVRSLNQAQHRPHGSMLNRVVLKQRGTRSYSNPIGILLACIGSYWINICPFCKFLTFWALRPWASTVCEDVVEEVVQPTTERRPRFLLHKPMPLMDLDI